MTRSEIDMFVSYNSKDRIAVEGLVAALRSRGLRPWVDFNDLPPGKPWQDEVEDVIRNARAAAILVGGNGLGPWELPEMRACLTQLVKRRVPVIPILLPGAPRELDLPVFLGELTWIDLRDEVSDEGIDRIIWGATGARTEQESVGSAPRHTFLEPTISCGRCGKQVAAEQAFTDGTCPECQRAPKWYQTPLKWPVKWPLTPRANILMSFAIAGAGVASAVFLKPEIIFIDALFVSYAVWSVYWGFPATMRRTRWLFSPWLLIIPVAWLIVPLVAITVAWFYSLLGGGLYEFVRFFLRNRLQILVAQPDPCTGRLTSSSAGEG